MNADRGHPWRADRQAVGSAAGLRVAVVITRLEGGAGRLALRGATAMDPEAFRMTIIAGSGDELANEASAAGLEFITAPSLRRPIDPRHDVAATRWLTALFGSRGFDVVHTHTAKAGAIGRLAAHRAHVPRIVHTYHGFPFHEFQSPARRRAYIAMEQRLGRFTDVALCVGTGVAAEAVRRRLVRPDRVRTIGVVVDGPGAAAASMSARSPEARARARRTLGLAADAEVVGTVGRLTYQKAPEDFLAALAKLGRPGTTGVWIGGGELADRVRRIANGLPDVNVLLTGERSDVLELLPAFDVFALASRYEGLPTVVVEAMLCGVPVVATAVNAVSDVVIPGETGLLVPARKPAQLAEAVRYLLDSPQTARRLADAARARVADRYSEPALREVLMSAYRPTAGAGSLAEARR